MTLMTLTAAFTYSRRKKIPERKKNYWGLRKGEGDHADTGEGLLAHSLDFLAEREVSRLDPCGVTGVVLSLETEQGSIV